MIASSAPSPEPARNRNPVKRGKKKKNTECEVARREKNAPASRPTTESFSQFEPDALTRYLKPITPRGQHTTSNMQVNRFSNRRQVTHADRLVSNGPPPHPMTTISKLGPWPTTSLTIPLAPVEVEGGSTSDLSSKAPTLIRQNRCSRLRR